MQATIMNRSSNRIALLSALGLAWATGVFAQDVVIQSFEHPGAITFTEMPEATSYTVEWAPAPGGPWTSSWENLRHILPTGQGAMTATVAMCYRVIAHGTSGGVAPVGMVHIPAGSFWMGDTLGDTGQEGEELPVHQVTFTQAMYMDETLVYSNQWAIVMNWSLGNGFSYTRATPAKAKTALHPVHTVHWRDAII